MLWGPSVWQVKLEACLIDSSQQFMQRGIRRHFSDQAADAQRCSDPRQGHTVTKCHSHAFLNGLV